MKITKKRFNNQYRIASGKELSNDINVYNAYTYSNANILSDIVFIVFSNDENIVENKTYIITGIRKNEAFDWAWRINSKDSFKYIYEVLLIDNEYYQQLEGSYCFSGVCVEKNRYKMNFEYKEKENKNTIFNLIKKYNINIDNIGLELFAISNYNYKLLENIYRFKGLDIFEQVNNKLKIQLLNKIDKSNTNKTEIENDLQTISTIKEFVVYMKENKNYILQKEQFHLKNDNVIYNYPQNLIKDNINIDFFANNKFNSAAPFYYQYRNYKIATILLLDTFINDFVNKTEETVYFLEQKNFQNKNIIEDSKNIDKINFGLYFPVFMNFRHSVELSFKLIYINEYTKKNVEPLKECNKQLNIHNLLKLLELIKPYLKKYINSEELKFYDDLCAFITYFENEDPSFSRYIINNELNFEKLKKINMHCYDLNNYIIEFYEIMDETLNKIDFGFDFKNIFTQ